MSALRAVVITGAPGSGKSAVIEALSGILAERGIEHGAMESEQLAWGYPWFAFLETLPQLGELLAAQRRAGRTLLLITATTETDEELETLVRALKSETVLVVALTCQPETAARRVLQREPPYWPGRDALADCARRLALIIPHLRRIDMTVATDERGPLDAAMAIADFARRHRYVK